MLLLSVSRCSAVVPRRSIVVVMDAADVIRVIFSARSRSRRSLRVASATTKAQFLSVVHPTRQSRQTQDEHSTPHEEERTTLRGRNVHKGRIWEAQYTRDRFAGWLQERGQREAASTPRKQQTRLIARRSTSSRSSGSSSTGSARSVRPRRIGGSRSIVARRGGGCRRRRRSCLGCGVVSLLSSCLSLSLPLQ